MKSCPGIGVKAAEWLVAKDPMLLGADNWPVEVAPNPDKQVSLPVHQIALVVNGIHLLENLKLDELAAKAGLRVRLRDAAAEDPGRQRLDGRPDRGAVSNMRRASSLRIARTGPPYLQKRASGGKAMQRIAFGAVLGAMLVSGSAALAQAPSWTPPPESARCPSKWGANDERGAANHMKPQSVLNAVKLIKTGEVIELGHVLSDKIPFSGTRRFDVYVKRTFLNQFSNMRGSNEEIVISEIGQVGTQFDGFAHQTHQNSWYNCFKVDENATALGLHPSSASIMSAR